MVLPHFQQKNQVILEKSCKNQIVGNLKILKILERLENLETISFCTSLKVEIPPLCIIFEIIFDFDDFQPVLCN